MDSRTVPLGLTVTQRIWGAKNIPAARQPRGGYVRPRDFDTTDIEPGIKPIPRETENISPSLVGTVVDYMARMQQGVPKHEAFEVSIDGATMAGQYDACLELLDEVRGEDAASVIAACKVASFDSWARAGWPNDLDKAVPDEATIENIQEMLRRCNKFFNAYGPMTLDGFGFEGAYTNAIINGEGDFLTSDTLWDFKVISEEPTSKHTLQLLVYWRMGLRSVHANAFQPITKLGLLNPRLGKVYILPVNRIPTVVIEQVEHEVIGYSQTSVYHIENNTAKEQTPANSENALSSNTSRPLVINNEPKKRHGGCLWFVVIILAILLLPPILQGAGCANGITNSENDTNRSEKASSSGKTEAPKQSDCGLKIIKTEVVEPSQPLDYKELAITLSWKNRSKDDTMFAMEIGVEAQQNGVILSGSTYSAAKSYAKLVDNNVKTIVNGKRLRTAFFFELDDSKHPVKVTFTDRHTDKVILEKTVKL